MQPVRQLIFTALAAAIASVPSAADSRAPGSLLIFPEFSNLPGCRTIVTVTNVNDDEGGAVDVEFRYKGARDADGNDLKCLEFNRTEHLTPNDTVTVLTGEHDPDDERGYLAVFPVDGWGDPIQFNHLVGHLLIIDGVRGTHCAVNPFVFEALGFGPGISTDVNGNHYMDLDGIEYAAPSSRYLVPRFIGQDRASAGELVLIDLSGVRGLTTVDLRIFNDNEEAFSAQHRFTCWDRISLSDVSLAFTQQFLSLYTNHDPAEDLSGYEYGWFTVRGRIANQGQRELRDPAILVYFIEVLNGNATADLPWEDGGPRPAERVLRIF